ncbi:NAD(P)/FAD-dependent oxidoreductase [Acinetobacter sp.]|uniref:NAD(P)/FAD-dependent oxidoreductase n=1 Tax=Acinetobacter sp. TaxID=472 RepID=UPI0035AE5521
MRIVIVGGGAGGLELATRLGNRLGKKNKAEIILVDATLTHIWKPLLHEVASGTLNSHDDELNYFAHAKKNHFEFYLGKMINIDRTHKTIQLEELSSHQGETIAPSRALAYDVLVVSVGSTSNDFNTEGAKEYCVCLDSRAQADYLQKEFLNLYLQAQANSLIENEKPSLLNIAIIGAGATGVELAAELDFAAHQFCKYGLDSIKPDNVQITLIEAADRVLPALNAKISSLAEEELLNMGIHVRTNSRVKKIDESYIYFEDGTQLPADLKVWSAGIKAPDFLKNIADLETNRINQLVVQSTLQTTRDECIFAMGDCASYTPEGKERPLAPRAQVANQQAIFLEKALSAYVMGQALPQFVFKDKGSLVSLSDRNSVGHVMGNINIEGFIARMMYMSLYRFHQIALHGLFKTGILMLKDVLAKSSRPQLKMH